MKWFLDLIQRNIQRRWLVRLVAIYCMVTYPLGYFWWIVKRIHETYSDCRYEYRRMWRWLRTGVLK